MIKIISFLKLFFLILWTLFIIGILIITLILTFHPTWVLAIVRKIWAPFVLFVMQINLKVEGLENMDRSKNYIIMSNHTSYLDIPILLVAVPKNIYFIAKKELLRIPFFGWMMWLLGMIFIDRSNPKKAVRSMKIAALKLKKGKNVLVFPEGTFADDGKLLPFKKGTFHIAIKAKMPILPVVIKGASQVWSGENLLYLKKGDVTVKFGEVFEASSPSNKDSIDIVEALKIESETRIKELLTNLG